MAAGTYPMAQQSRSAVDMLKDIPSETAQQMFNAIRYQTDPPGSTMILELDEYMLASMDSVTSLNSSLNRGDVIEIQGPAASGKTQLLYHLVATCILPSELLVSSLEVHAEYIVPIGGWQKSVIVFDCDGRWDIRRLHSILVSRVKHAFSIRPLPPLPHKTDVSVSSVALNALSRLHLFHPTSSLQLSASILTLPKYHKENMCHEEIRLLLVDSISSFHWADRWQAEPSGTRDLFSNSLGNVLRSLQAFRLSHAPVTILTNWGLNPYSFASSASSNVLTPFFRQHLSSPYPAPLDDPPRQIAAGELSLSLTCHITLSHTFISPFQIDPQHLAGSETACLEEALTDKNKKEVKRHEVVGYIRNPRPQRTQDATSRRAFGKFSFEILGHDVISSS